MERPRLFVTQDMIDEAVAREPNIKVNRTRTSKYDTVGGAVGEFIFAEYFYGNWREHHEVGSNKGKADFKGIVEIKTSIVPFTERLHLVVREDYLNKRRVLYVQIILSVSSRKDKNLIAGTEAIVCGFATPEMFDGITPGPMNMGGFLTAYDVYQIPITKLRPMERFREAYDRF